MPGDSTTAPDDSSDSSTPCAPSPAPHGAGDRAVPPPPPFPPPALSPLIPTPPASPASAADAGATDRCPVASCGVAAVDNPFWFGVRAHLRDAHRAVDVATAVLHANRLRGCPHCGELFSFGRSAAARRALSDHTAVCVARPGVTVEVASPGGATDAAAAAGDAAASDLPAPPRTAAAAGGLDAVRGAAPQLGACPLSSCGAHVGAGGALVAHLRAAHTAVDVPADLLAEQQLRGCRHCHRLFSVAPTAAGHRPLNSHEPNCSIHPLLRGGRGPAAVAAAAMAAGAATASAADLASWATRTCCVVPGCTTTFRGTVTPRTLPAHLARAHKLASVPRTWVTAMRLGGCRYCGRPYRTPLDGRRQNSLRRHEVRCAQRPAPEPDTDTDEPLAPRAAARGAPSHVGGDNDAPMAGATDDQVANATGDLAADALGDQAADELADQAAGAAARPPTPNPATLFLRERSEWERRRASFLLVQAPTPDAWPALVASGARTADRVPASMLPVWQQLGADALAWARREPGNATAWLWLLTLPSLLLHVPARTRGRGEGPAPLTHAARVAAIFEGNFSDALRDRNVGVWRDSPGSSGPPAAPVAPAAPPSPLPPVSPVAPPSQRAASATPQHSSLVGLGVPHRPTSTRLRLTRVQRRALRQVWRGRLSAAARTLQGAPAAPHTCAVWRAAQRLFPRAAPGLATTASVEAEFGPELDVAAAQGAAGGAPSGLSAATVVSTIRSAARGSAPGPSGLRMEHLWALAEDGREAQVGVVQLLASDAATSVVPAAASHALAGAELLLLVKQGTPDADGVPKLRPIGMPETLRKLVAGSLARALRASAASLMAPLQMGIGVPNACERLLHALEAQLEAAPEEGVLLLDYKNAFNLVSRAAARAFVDRAFPSLTPHVAATYGGDAPAVYGWAVAPDGGGSGDNVTGEGGAGGSAHERPPSGADDNATDHATEWVPPPPARRVLTVERGTQQGDPLGPFLHAAAMMLVLMRLARLHPTHVIDAFHDDVRAVGPVEGLGAVLESASRVGALVDAELAPSKCVAWSPGTATAPPNLTAQWRSEGVEQFSIPLGSRDFVAGRVAAMAAENAAGVAAIEALPEEHLQTKLLLLRFCAGPRVTYALRSLPPDMGATLAAAVDADVQRTLLALLCDADDAADLRAAALARAALPVRMGGLGLGDRSRIAAAAVVASWADAASHCHNVAAPALASLGCALAEVDADEPAVPAGALVDTSSWPGAPDPPPADGVADLSSPPAAGAPPLARRPALLPGLLAVVAKLNAASAAAPPPPCSAPDLLVPPADAQIAANGLLRVAGGTRLTWARLLGGDRVPSQRDLTAPVHLAALERLRAGLVDTGDLARLAACRGSGAGRWLSALPAPGRPAGVFGGRAMRLATRLWLGMPPVAPVAVGRRCACGTMVDAFGLHFLAACRASPTTTGLTFRHHALVARTADALRAHPQWWDVEEEVSSSLFAARSETLRPDVRAVRVRTGGAVWGDVSVASAFTDAVVAAVAAQPSVAVAAVAREARKMRKYAPRLPAADPPSVFTPLVWEVFGRVGPASADFLRTAVGGPGRSRALALLLTDASAIIWRYNARMLSEGIARCDAGGRSTLDAPPAVARFSG